MGLLGGGRVQVSEVEVYIMFLHFIDLRFDCLVLKIHSDLGRGECLGVFHSGFMMSLAPCSVLTLIPPHLHLIYVLYFLLLLLKLLTWIGFLLSYKDLKHDSNWSEETKQ